MPRKKVEEIYQKKTQLEHILLRPDSYVGSVGKDTAALFVLSDDRSKMEERQIEYAPALYKIFDEILVNAADNKQRDPTMKKIEVNVNIEGGYISVKNDGRGIPIEIHREHGCYVPELIFGHLLTSSNYDDTDKKTVGGRNGYGAKLANIFSTRFRLDTVDSAKGKRYTQEWSNNMRSKGEPKIRDVSSSKKDYTEVRFWPDFSRFQMSGFDAGIVKLIEKRVFDIAGTSAKDLKVYYNGDMVPVATFEDYAKLFIGTAVRKNIDFFYFKSEDKRTELIFALSPDQEYRQISHVNSIWTMKGGTHVKAIMDQMVKYAKENFKTREKAMKEMLRPMYIRNQLFLFVNNLIENPTFSSQTKEEMTLNKSKWGTSPTVPDSVLKKVFNKIKAQIKEFLELKLKQGAKKSDGKKKKKVRVDDAIDDANHAGTRHSAQCTLILTEGLSAKTLAVAGLSVLPGGRNRFGIFPLKGKLLNVRDESRLKVNKNTEIKNLKEILGLKANTDYSSEKAFKQLRYGRVMIMTDQDNDGSHIKGLVVNWLHYEWPSLVKRPSFVTQFITPILVATKGKGASRRKLPFYTVPEYDKWKLENNGGKGWKVKYYKGLGTWQRDEGKAHFEQLAKHNIEFSYRNEGDDAAIVKAFDKKKTDDRKVWLQGYEPGTYLDFTRRHPLSGRRHVTYSDFIDKELILFSIADNKRSIPSMVDGFKPGQRKIMYCCFLKGNLSKEIRVAQLGGYVSEKSAYHHGEMSLYQTIIGMAQDFPGSNNINLIEPKGMFGSRLKGGKDAASARYIYTKMSGVTQYVFHGDDNMILKFLDDDGFPVEPQFYMPVIPMVLVNGAEGIGTGWSTSVPTFNPRDIIDNIRRRLNAEAIVKMQPWFRGWNGVIQETESPKRAAAGVYYETLGRCNVVFDENAPNLAMVEITELPVKMWTENYKKFLEDLEEAEVIEEFQNNSNDVDVNFTVVFDLSKTSAASKPKRRGRGGRDASVSVGADDDSKAKDKKTRNLSVQFSGEIDAKFLKDMKLRTTIATSNMVLFDSESKIKKYATVEGILEDFYVLRLEGYGKRKRALLEKLRHELKQISNRCRFILEVIEEKLIIRKRKKLELVRELIERRYDSWFAYKNKNSLEARRALVQKMDGAEEVGGDGIDASMAAGSGEELEDASMDVDGERVSTAHLSDKRLKQMANGFNYLLTLPLLSLTQEKVEELLQQQSETEARVQTVEATAVETMWRTDLDALEKKLDSFDKGFEERCQKARKQTAKMVAAAKKGAKKTTKGRTVGRKKATKKTAGAKKATKTKRKVTKKGETTKGPKKKLALDSTLDTFWKKTAKAMDGSSAKESSRALSSTASSSLASKSRSKSKSKSPSKSKSKSKSASTSVLSKASSELPSPKPRKTFDIFSRAKAAKNPFDSDSDSSSPMLSSLALRAQKRRESVSGNDSSPQRAPRKIAKRSAAEMESSSVDSTDLEMRDSLEKVSVSSKPKARKPLAATNAGRNQPQQKRRRVVKQSKATALDSESDSDYGADESMEAPKRKTRPRRTRKTVFVRDDTSESEAGDSGSEFEPDEVDLDGDEDWDFSD